MTQTINAASFTSTSTESTIASLPTRAGWRPWATFGEAWVGGVAGEGGELVTIFTAYQAEGQFGVQGQGEEWAVVYASDGTQVVEVPGFHNGTYVSTSYETPWEAMLVADKLEADLADAAAALQAEREAEAENEGFSLTTDGVTTKLFASTLEEAIEEAASDLRNGWEPTMATFWAHGTIEWEDEDGAHEERVTATIEPREPKCGNGGHAWTECGTSAGENGGYTCHEECSCGWRRTTETRASDPVTGQVMGEAVRYERIEDEE